MVLDDDVMRRVGARKRACARRLIWSSGDYADDASRGLVSEECKTSPILALSLSPAGSMRSRHAATVARAQFTVALDG
jgi:hypothetical protein